MPFTGGMSRPGMVLNSDVREDLRRGEIESEIDRRWTEPTNEPKQKAETQACKMPNVSYTIKEIDEGKGKVGQQSSKGE